jgi:hypothetical protein
MSDQDHLLDNREYRITEDRVNKMINRHLRTLILIITAMHRDPGGLPLHLNKYR